MVEEVRELVAWSQTTRTGDRADLSFEPSDRAWNMLSVGPRECPGAFNCPSGGSCFAEAARDRAAAADIVVVNTHLYGAHLASGGVVLPEHEVVVFDEAHELEEVMTSSLGVELTPGRFRTLVTAARPLVEAAGRRPPRLPGRGGRPPRHLAVRPRRRPRAAGRRPATPDDDDLSDLLARASEVSRRVVDALRRGGAQRSFISGDGDDPDRASRKTRTLQAAAHLAEDLHRLVGRTDGEVAWVDGTRRDARLRLSPIDVGPTLAGVLWGTITAVLTSATIPPRVVERVGLEDFPTEELNVGSPFDYRAHALLYVARHLPDRRAEGAEDARLRRAGPLDRGGGRAHPGAVHEPAGHRGGGGGARDGTALHDPAPGRPAQGPPARGVRLRRDLVPVRHARLLAGRRHPGPRALARDDRPAAVPAARRPAAAGAGATGPAAAPSRWSTCPAPPRCWRRAPGRLIRTADDKGVVAVLDPRLATASYRGVLLATLPPMRRSVDRSEVESFLRRALDDEDDGA